MNRSLGRIAVFFGLLSAVLLTSTLIYSARSEKYGRYIMYSNERAMSELVSQLSQMDSALAKLRYASTPRSFQTTAAKLWQSAETAKSCMSALSLSTGDIDNTEKFVAQTGDLAYYMLFASSGGDEISRDNLDALESLYSAAESVNRELSALKGQIDVGQMSFGGISAAASDYNEVPLSGGMSGVEQEFPEYATLIYDGPFSEHLSYSTPKLLDGMKEVTLEQAMNNASTFLGIKATELRLLYEGGDKIKCYCLETRDGKTLEVSKAGGLVFTYRNPRAVGDAVLYPKEATDKAREFLESHGFKNMRESYYTVYDGTVVINFAYTSNDIIVYGDLIKVSVALDNGEIVGMEAKGYLMSHTDRTLPAPKVASDDAAKKLSPWLKVESVNLALIPTSGQNEVLCHEYVCTDMNGMHVIVYVNAASGQEENMYILIEDENGTLTI